LEKALIASAGSARRCVLACPRVRKAGSAASRWSGRGRLALVSSRRWRMLGVMVLLIDEDEKQPQCLAYVHRAEGWITLIRIETDATANVAIGDPVRVVFRRAEDCWSMLTFVPGL
jgi:uncharacterized OB-fold protein